MAVRHRLSSRKASERLRRARVKARAVPLERSAKLVSVPEPPLPIGDGMQELRLARQRLRAALEERRAVLNDYGIDPERIMALTDGDLCSAEIPSKVLNGIWSALL